MQFLMHSVIEGLQPISSMIIFRVREPQEIVPFHKRLFTAISDRKKTIAVEALTDLAVAFLPRSIFTVEEFDSGPLDFSHLLRSHYFLFCISQIPR